MITYFKRIFRAGWQNFSRDWGISIATIFILVMAIFLVSSLLIFRDANRFLISSLQEKADISVYFKESLSEEEIFNIKDELSRIPEVKAINYVSQEKAKEIFVEKHKDDPVLMGALEEVGNPFLASLSIKAWQASQYQAVVNFLEKDNFKEMIEKVDYYQNRPIIERIFSLTSFFDKAGIILTLILVIVAILVTFNTIRLAIYNSAEEIKIQRLVGAGNWFIRGPFLVQGTICGIIATLICLLIFSLTCWFLARKLNFSLPGLIFLNC